MRARSGINRKVGDRGMIFGGRLLVGSSDYEANKYNGDFLRENLKGILFVGILHPRRLAFGLGMNCSGIQKTPNYNKVKKANLYFTTSSKNNWF